MSKIKNIAYIMIFLIVLFALAPKSEAAGLVIAFSKSTANVGDTVTVTVTGSGVTGKVNLSVSGNATLSQSSVWVDNNSTSVTATITGTGSIRITATAADMADSTTSDPYSGATAGTITVANSSSGTGSSGGTSNSGGTSSSGSTSTTKSSNANLSNLGIRPNDFSGFKPGTTSYTVTVPNDVSSVQIYASKGQSGQSISGTGNKTLKEGTNTFKVVVTAEDGKTQKTYTLTINREAKSNTETPEETENTENTENTETTENTENEEQVEENTEFGLKELSIEGITLSPEFKTDVYEYTAKLIGEATSLKINTSATDETAKVEITGNENLQEGENTVTILVTNESGEETVAYQIKVTKSLVDEEALAKQKEIEEQEKQRKIILISAVVAAIIIIAIIIIIRHRRNKKLAEEYTIPFMNMNQDDDENNYDDTYSDDEDSYQKITNKFLHKDKERTDLENTKDIPVLQNTYSTENENATVEQNNVKENENNNAENNVIPEYTSTVNEEKDEKAKLREEYLNQSFETMEDFDEKPSRKRHSKGKRFKK